MTSNAATSLLATCRLCKGKLSLQFTCRVLGKHEVEYLKCSGCGALQAEEPYWLEDAYKINLASLDTGAAQRNLDSAAAALLVCQVLDLQNALDVGGGDGLFCRLMRDYGVNCYSSDRYASSVYSQGFTTPDFAVPQLVTAFEVIEHFACPSKDLDSIFALDAGVILISTALYESQMGDWWYLAPESGQHVFFYSAGALDWIGERYGYQYLSSGNLVLFFRPRSIGTLQRWRLALLLNPLLRRPLRAFMSLRRTPGVWRDHVAVKTAESAKER
jgi:hypothetical protein